MGKGPSTNKHATCPHPTWDVKNHQHKRRTRPKFPCAEPLVTSSCRRTLSEHETNPYRNLNRSSNFAARPELQCQLPAGVQPLNDHPQLLLGLVSKGLRASVGVLRGLYKVSTRALYECLVCESCFLIRSIYPYE